MISSFAIILLFWYWVLNRTRITKFPRGISNQRGSV